MQLGKMLHYVALCQELNSYHPLPAITQLQGQHLMFQFLGIGV